MVDDELTDDQVSALDAWWRAANYLSVGQIYLMDNPLLRRPLVARGHQAAPARPLGHHAGAQPAVDPPQPADPRARRRRDLPRRARPRRAGGRRQRLARGHLQRDLPARRATTQRGHAASCSASSPSPAGSRATSPRRRPARSTRAASSATRSRTPTARRWTTRTCVVAAVVGDGEAETGPLAASWHANKFVDPVHDGAVLPILHLNGYKIANPTVLARIPRDGAATSLLRGYGHEVLTVEGDDPCDVHRQLAAALDQALDRIREIQRAAREDGDVERRPWPMIVLRHPEGLDRAATWSTACRSRAPGAPTRCRSPAPATNADHRAHAGGLAAVLPPRGAVRRPRAAWSPSCVRWRRAGDRRMGANPHANGGLLRASAPTCRTSAPHAVDVAAPGASMHEADPGARAATCVDVMRDNPDNFRIFGPDETASNRLDAVYEVTDKVFAGDDPRRSTSTWRRSGRVMEILSEHTCQGWLEGYLLTGRHGLFTCYEAFIHLVDSMVNQHAKWLKTTRAHPLAPPDRVPELPAHLARVAPGPQRLLPPGPRLHRPRREQEGRGRPGLPAAGRQHPAVDDATTAWRSTRLRQRGRGRQAADLRLARRRGGRPALRPRPGHLGLGVRRRTATPTSCSPAPATCPPSRRSPRPSILREHLPELRGAGRQRGRPDAPAGRRRSTRTGCPTREFDAVFTTDRPVIFAYHGYPWLIHRLTYRRTDHDNIHVRGYKEEGTTTTPFDMVVMNDLDRYHLVMDVIDRVPGLGRARRGAAPGDGRHPAPGPRLDPRARRGPARGPRLGVVRAAEPGT